MTVEPMTDATLATIARLKQRGAWSNVLESIRLRFEQDAATISTLTAERDAAVARAMPAPRLMRTVEEVEALAPGAYRLLTRWLPREWIAGQRLPTGTWTLLLGAGASGVMDESIVGAWISGPLPDLPTPTAGETP